eukprot:m.114670 g.114670  ORF g.114670 m.114670 type:complete len:290 (+) comp14175_c0_seq9:103-972(+)
MSANMSSPFSSSQSEEDDLLSEFNSKSDEDIVYKSTTPINTVFEDIILEKMIRDAEVQIEESNEEIGDFNLLNSSENPANSDCGDAVCTEGIGDSTYKNADEASSKCPPKFPIKFPMERNDEQIVKSEVVANKYQKCSDLKALFRKRYDEYSSTQLNFSKFEKQFNAATMKPSLGCIFFCYPEDLEQQIYKLAGISDSTKEKNRRFGFCKNFNNDTQIFEIYEKMLSRPFRGDSGKLEFYIGPACIDCVSHHEYLWWMCSLNLCTKYSGRIITRSNQLTLVMVRGAIIT